MSECVSVCVCVCGVHVCVILVAECLQTNSACALMSEDHSHLWRSRDTRTWPPRRSGDRDPRSTRSTCSTPENQNEILSRFLTGFLTGFMRDSDEIVTTHEFPTRFTRLPWHSLQTLTRLSLDYHEILTGFSQGSHEILTGLSRDFTGLSRDSREILMGLSWDSHEILTELSQDSREILENDQGSSSSSTLASGGIKRNVQHSRLGELPSP